MASRIATPEERRAAERAIPSLRAESARLDAHYRAAQAAGMPEWPMAREAWSAAYGAFYRAVRMADGEVL